MFACKRLAPGACHYTVPLVTDLQAFLVLLQIGRRLHFTGSPGFPIFLLFLLKLWSPVNMTADLVPLIQGSPLFHSLGNVEPRPQHSCN